MRNRPATIKDIARKLRISISTVSRALRNFPDVNPETKKAVLEMAEQLDYQPNSIATSLVTKKSNTLGIVIPSFVIYYYASAISGIQETAAKAGYNVMVCHSNESYAMEVANVMALTSARVDGLIVSLSKETKNFEHFRQVQRKGIPLVFFNRICEELEAPYVVVDDYDGAYQAVEHLIQTGSTRIAHIAGPEGLQNSRNRLNGYIDALKKKGFPVDESLIRPSDFTIESGRECTKALLDLSQPPDAIFAVNDSAAYGAMFEIKRRGLTIPDDVAIVGFTNEPLTELVEPALTTVAQPVYELGKNAAELFLIRTMSDPKTYVPESRILKTKLIVRESSVKQRKQGYPDRLG